MIGFSRTVDTLACACVPSSLLSPVEGRRRGCAYVCGVRGWCITAMP